MKEPRHYGKTVAKLKTDQKDEDNKIIDAYHNAHRYYRSKIDALSDEVFVTALDGQCVPHWSRLWERINRLSHAKLLRVIAINRYNAKIEKRDA